MIEQLFGSKTRVKLLGLFYSNPNRPFYVREITRKIDEQINSVRRELSNLLSIGIISSETNNNRLYYEVNQEYQYYKPLAMIFGGAAGKPTLIRKKKAADAVLEPNDAVDDIRKLGNLELAVYTGQFTRDDTSGIDILLVGDLNPTKLEKFIAALEKEEGKELRYTVLSSKDFEYRRQVNDRFLNMVLNSKKQVLVDKNNLFNTEAAE